MITLEQYNTIISELLDELPEEFFRELSGGVIVSEALVIPDYARDNDLFTLGQYQFYSGVRQIVMFRGSFNRVHPYVGLSEAKPLLRNILRHEFRHHLELLGGVHNSSSLEAVMDAVLDCEEAGDGPPQKIKVKVSKTGGA